MQEGQTDFLDLMEPEPAAAPAADVVTDKTSDPAPPEAKADDRPRNPDGTFAEKPKDEQVTKGDKPEGQAPPEPAPPAEHEGDRVPIAALKAEREKRQALEAELAKLRPAAQSQTQPTPKGPEFQLPQVEDGAALDPRFHAMRMQMSSYMAKKDYGEATLATAWDAFDQACKAQPGGEAEALSFRLQNHPHPMEEVVKWHQRQQQFREIEEAGGLDKLIARKLAEAQANAPAAHANGALQQPAAQRPAPPTPPPSLARGGAGSIDAPELPSEDDDFNGLFEGARKPRKR